MPKPDHLPHINERVIIKREPNDLIELVQRPRHMFIYAAGTDWLLGKIKGTGPWYTYTKQEWSNDEQKYLPIPKVTHTWTLDMIRESYNNRMMDHFVHCQT
jgi:hypothetical protein